MLKYYGKLCFTVYMLRIVHLQHTEFNAWVVYVRYNISHVSFCIYLFLFQQCGSYFCAESPEVNMI